MCGIFGIVAGAPYALSFDVEKALFDLRYRGYDSWGIAVLGEGTTLLSRGVGKLEDCDVPVMKGTRAIGHTRWATHGKVTVDNAHPHVDFTGKIHVVHNGIIENYRELRSLVCASLSRTEDDVFHSQTDSEVVPHLIALIMSNLNLSFENAFIHAMQQLKGHFAVAAICEGVEGVYAACSTAPIIVGGGDYTHAIASDIIALLEISSEVARVPQDSIVHILHNRVRTWNLSTGALRDEPLLFAPPNISKDDAKKGDFPHFMLKEIYEQHEVLLRLANTPRDVFKIAADLVGNFEHVIVTGCGSAFNMARSLESLRALRHKRITISLASELRNEDFVDLRNTVVIAVSQSGETADVLNVVREAKLVGATIVAVVNTRSSTLEALADCTVPVLAGPEIGVAATKTAMAQYAACLLLLVAIVGEDVNKVNIGYYATEIKKALAVWSPQIEILAQRFKEAPCAIVLARGGFLPIASEIALKMQEICYMPTIAFPTAELKHGPLALVEAGVPVIVIAGSGDERVEHAISEVVARGGEVIIVGGGPKYQDSSQPFASADQIALPILSLLFGQLFAYHLSVARGNDPDMPRNLAKCVTVS